MEVEVTAADMEVEVGGEYGGALGQTEVWVKKE
jgi:hypothetical protein